MSTLCNSDCEDLGEHEVVACGLQSKGGIRAIGRLNCSQNSSAINWESGAAIQALITAGQLTVVKGVSATLPKPSPLTHIKTGQCSDIPSVDLFEYTLTFEDDNISQNNNDFYDVGNYQRSELVYFNCSQGTLSVSGSAAVFIVTPMIPMATRENQKYEGEVKWESRTMPVIYDLDAAGIAIFS